jgi:hypothetical protein
MLLHAFQEHVISDQGICTANPTELGLIPSKMSAIVDLQQTTGKKRQLPLTSQNLQQPLKCFRWQVSRAILCSGC